mmetsp:Transcript_32830/g.69053  ORF Transcript_32830/g.69053 Transcript_32830/m.69053 type:complete len:656 (+) Transcript_32830:34-2001(+)
MMESNADNPHPMTHPLQENSENAVVGNNSGGGLSQLAMSMIGGGGGSATMPAPVPDVLLSLAKDNRYISEVASLLSQVAVPFASIFLLPRRGGDGRNRSGTSSMSTSRRSSENYNGDDIFEDDGERFIERIRPELNFLASMIVHSATFIFYTRNFGYIAGANNNSGIIKRSLGMESLNLAYRYPVKKRSDSATLMSTSVKQSNNKRNIFRDYLMMIFPSWKINQWHRLLFLQTMVPYIIQRVGRGGWSKDLGGLFSTLLDRCGMGHIRLSTLSAREISNRTGNEQRIEEDSLAPRNDDRLRGSARRRLFDEQRRRMLHSSSDTAQVNANANLDGDSDDSATVNEANANGMLDESPSLSANGVDNNQSRPLRSLGNDAFHRRLKRMSTLSWNVINKISLAVSALSHGAHSLPRHLSVAAGENLDRYAKMIKWFLRLHLALFYWNGIYPTVAHRLVGAKIRDDVAPHSTGSSYSPMSGAIVANRPTYKPIAAIILFQALAALAQTTAEASIEVAHFIQVYFFRWRRRRRMQQQQQNNGSLTQDEHSLPLNRTNSERAEYMDLIEERVPGIASAMKDSMNTMHKSRVKKQKQLDQSGSDTHPCGICLNERANPAAPSVCGHVFCWNCILHWVSNVRAECPLCRAQTRPQDIIPLYNYA